MGFSRLFAVASLLGLATTSCHASTAKLHWLGDAPTSQSGTTFGVPWPQGSVDPDSNVFTLSGDGNEVPLQSWVTGYWLDGTVKWSGHAIPADAVAEEYTITAETEAKRAKRTNLPREEGELRIQKTDVTINVNTGKITAVFPTQGNVLVKSITTASGKQVGANGKLVLHSQSGVPDVGSKVDASVNYFNFESHIEDVSVSQDSSVRAVVTVKGKHQVTAGGDHDDWMPFVVRFYLYDNSDSIRVVHSLVFDGEASEDFISGIGIRFDVPLKEEELYNRHVRMPGVGVGFLNEAVQGITGLRRDPGEDVRIAQVTGKELPDISTWDTRVSSRMHWIPVWNDYRLSQLSPDGFVLKKRTEEGQTWINIPGGTRSHGLTYLGGATGGGLAVGLRDFWKRYPTGVDVANAGTDNGQLTIWIYSPEGQPLDLRGFHDGMGQDTYEEQLDALEVTYEDYEPGFDTPYGIARTNEVFIYAFDSTPESDTLGKLAQQVDAPPVLGAEPAYIRETKALGAYWEVPDTSSPEKALLEENLDFLFQHYVDSVEDRRWYGFLDYGDFMHSYDADRHQWKYDVGGYAWDNSELSPDLFFWLQFLRTGREDIYRFAEALNRHTGEVDMYHLGNWTGLGTRHGVLHYGDSAKQARIAQPYYRKFFYFFSGGDERTGEIMEETLDADKTYGILDAVRKVRTDGWTPSPDKPASVGLGTDWGALAAGWLIEWERRGPRWEESREKLLATAGTIADLKNGFVTGSGLYTIANGTLAPPPSDPNNEGIVAISHLSAVFGLPEVVADLLEYWDGDEDSPDGFEEAWLDYCYYYGATDEEQTARYGEAFSGVSLIQGHSRVTAYFAWKSGGNETVAERAWEEFIDISTGGFLPSMDMVTETIEGSDVLAPIREAKWVDTNSVAQYGLAVIQNLAFIGDSYSG